MPWCEDCSKYLTPSTVNPDGTCPTCGRPVDETERRSPDNAEVENAEVENAEVENTEVENTEVENTPWHFKLLVVAIVGYLGWRLVQLVGLAG